MVQHRTEEKREDTTNMQGTQYQQSLLAQVPKILKLKHLKCVDHTPASASILHDAYGYFANGKEMPHDVERTLFDAFIENDYDGRLHLSTLHYFEERDTSTNTNTIPSSSDDDDDDDDDDDEGISIGPPLGLVFWREVPDPEMNDWFDWEHVTNALQRHKKNDHDENKNASSSSEKKNNRFVRHNSIESIQNMIESLHLHTATGNETQTIPDGIEIDLQNLDLAHDDMVHAWTKLELIAVRERYWGRHLGSLLLACALYNAHYKFDQSRVVLHIAGGEENAPALRLYERFGFLRIKSGTSFHKPDRYMYVLGDIAYALGHTMWKGENIEHIDPHESDPL